jgi:RNA polymerase sigma-70 factor (ECF subfamily)
MAKASYSEDEIESLITETERALIRFAARYLHDHASACDAVQDAYIRYVRFLQGPPPGEVEHPAAWLFRTTRNICLDVLKSAHRRMTVSLTPEMELPETAPGADSVSASADENRLLRSLFRILSDREQEIVILKVDHEKSYKEIAEIMGLSVSNIGFILNGAMNKLRAAYRERGSCDEGL